MDHTRISIFLLNSRGTFKNYGKILEDIKQHDIVLLQEQHIDKNQEYLRKYEKDTNSKAYYSTDEKNNKSIIILAKNNLKDFILGTEIIVKG